MQSILSFSTEMWSGVLPDDSSASLIDLKLMWLNEKYKLFRIKDIEIL